MISVSHKRCALSCEQGSVCMDTKINNDQGLEQEKVNVDSLANLVGFPKDFIKKELLVDSDEITLSALREKMVQYLERTNKDLMN